MSIACLVVMGEAKRQVMLTQGWEDASNKTKQDVQAEFDCCGLDEHHVNYGLCVKQKDEVRFHVS